MLGILASTNENIIVSIVVVGIMISEMNCKNAVCTCLIKKTIKNGKYHKACNLLLNEVSFC